MIEIKNVSKWYGPVQVLNDCSVNINKGDVVVVIPNAAPDMVTPLSEGYQGVVWHCLVSHPALQVQSTKW